MPPRSAEEKERRRLQHEQKKQARTLAKEQKEREEAEKKAALEKLKKRDLADEAGRNSDGSVEDDFCYFLTLPEDSQNNIMCFLAARDLGHRWHSTGRKNHSQQIHIRPPTRIRQQVHSRS